MEGILGKKLGMIQVFDEEGWTIPVTAIEAGPCWVTQIKTKEHEGYDAVQLGFDPIRPSSVVKPLQGHFNKSGVKPKRLLKEFRLYQVDDYKLGQQVKVDIFKVGEYVDVAGTSIGKGFAGVMKRWGFAGGPASHGAHKWHRRPGSIGASASPSRVFKGKKMPGRMGGERTTIQRLKIVRVDPQNNLLLVKGAVPGAKGGYLVVTRTKKPKKGAG